MLEIITYLSFTAAFMQKRKTVWMQCILAAALPMHIGRHLWHGNVTVLPYICFLRTSTDVSSSYRMTERTGTLSEITRDSLDSLMEYCDTEHTAKLGISDHTQNKQCHHELEMGN